MPENNSAEPAFFLAQDLLHGGDFGFGMLRAAHAFENGAGLLIASCLDEPARAFGNREQQQQKHKAGTASAPSIQRQPEAAFQASSPSA